MVIHSRFIPQAKYKCSWKSINFWKSYKQYCNASFFCTTVSSWATSRSTSASSAMHGGGQRNALSRGYTEWWYLLVYLKKCREPTACDTPPPRSLAYHLRYVYRATVKNAHTLHTMVHRIHDDLYIYTGRDIVAVQCTATISLPV